jgi:hypothetical protein
VIKQITGNEQEIHVYRAGPINNALETAIIQGTMCLPLVRFPITVAIEMHISCMQDF